MRSRSLGEVGVIFLIVLVEDRGVFGVGLRSVDGREMLPLSQFLIQTPKDLDNT